MHTCIDPFSFPIQIPLLCVQAYILLLLDIVGRQTLPALQLPYAVTVYYIIMLLTVYVKTIADNIMIIIMSGI